MRKSFVLAVVLALGAGTALAAPAVYNHTQKGSLLIFADIDVRAGKATIINVTNDGDSSVALKCVYVDFEKNRTDFVIGITPHQSVWFDAATGAGSITVAEFPTEGRLTGALTCFAVGNADTQMAYNHLIGNAEVMDFIAGTIYKYNAAAFYRPADGTRPGELVLNGYQYDACGQYLIAQFTPVGAVRETPAGTVATLQNRLVVASCTQDLSQDYVLHTTKLQFDVWNANEVKFTGAWDCADSWHEVILGGPTLVRGNAPKTFTAARLGTSTAYYRVQGVKSTQCDYVAPWGTTTEAVGLVGVQSTLVDINGVVVAEGTSLNLAGKRNGLITFDASYDAPEKR